MIITSNPTHSSFSRVSDVLNGEALSDTLGKLDSAPRAQGLPHIRGDPSFAGGELRAELRIAQCWGPLCTGGRVQLPHSNKLASPRPSRPCVLLW